MRKSAELKESSPDNRKAYDIWVVGIGLIGKKRSDRFRELHSGCEKLKSNSSFESHSGAKLAGSKSALAIPPNVRRRVVEPFFELDHMVQADYATDMHEAEITKARNDWKEHPNGESYKQRLVEALGRDRAAHLDRHGQELEAEFAKALQAAEAGKRARGGKVKTKQPIKNFALGGAPLVAYSLKRKKTSWRG